MDKVKVRFLGSGDAFGSGGRLQSCVLVEDGERRFLIDCGATTMVAIRRFQIDPNSIGFILATNFHGDHFGGIPYFIIDAQLNSRRVGPLTIAGPSGVKERFLEVMEAAFPGSSQINTRFPLRIVELESGKPCIINEVNVTPYPVIHPEGGHHLAVHIEYAGRILAYTGDTEWTTP